MPGFIVNTNRSEEPPPFPSETYMLEEGVALVTGEKVTGEDPWLRLLDKIGVNDMVFLYANDEGIIARGKATGETYYPDQEFCGNPGRCLKLREFAKLSNPIKFAELPIQPPPILSRAVVKISDDAAQRIWNIASGRLS